MRTFSLLLPLLLLSSACTTPTALDVDSRGQALAQRFLILDGHIDVPYRLYAQRERDEMDDVGEATEGGDFDHPRAVAGGLDAPFMSIFTPARAEDEGQAKKVADELIDIIEDLVRRHPARFSIARTAAEVRSSVAEGKIALLLGMENGGPIEGDLANLEHFHRRGVRYITLCHSKDNHICDSSYDTNHTHRGMTPFGREVVRRMNELGVLIDVSHISDDSFWQVMELTRAPVIASHSSLRHFVPGFERNMSDEMVRAVGKNGGVVQINFGSTFLTAEANGHRTRRSAAREEIAGTNGGAKSEHTQAAWDEWDSANPFPFADVGDVADHIDRVVDLAGIEHVGFGSDYDGVGNTLPIGMKDVSMYPNLIAELLRRGYSEDALEKICSGNVLRVMEQNEALAARLRLHEL